jgi:sialic acid synthase SpsE
LAVAAGASIIEKHLTYDCSAPGPDHAASADPRAFAEYIRLIRLAQRFRGSPGKRVLSIEQDVRKVSRQSLVLTRDLSAGSTLTADDLATQRPAAGIPAACFDQLIGRRLARDLPAGTMLQWDMLEGSVVRGPLSVALDSQ